MISTVNEPVDIRLLLIFWSDNYVIFNKQVNSQIGNTLHF